MKSNNERVQLILQHLDITLEDYYTVSTLAKKVEKSIGSIYELLRKLNIPTELRNNVTVVKGSSIVEATLVDFDYNFNEDYISMNEIEQRYEGKFIRKDRLEIPKKLERISIKGLPLTNHFFAHKYHKNAVEGYFKDKYKNIPLDILRDVMRDTSNGKSYVNITEIAKEIGCSASYVKDKLPESELYFIGKIYYTHKDNLNIVKELYEMYLRNKELTPIQLIQEKIKSHNLANVFPVTTELFIEFALININKTRKSGKSRLREYANKLVKTYDYLISCISKEVTELTEKEIVLILTRGNVSKNLLQKISPFFKWVSHKVLKVNYNDVPVISYKQNPNKITPYNAQEFYRMYDFVNDYDIHLDKAISNYSYAQCWFITCMNFTNAWRLPDVCDFPLPNLDTLDERLSFEWFKSNRLSLSDSQKVVNDVIEKNQFTINKTGALNKLFVHQDILISFATALCLNELHRQASSKNNLLPLLITNTYQVQIKKFFPKDSPKYSYLKVTTSLLTNLEREARDMGNLGGISNVISSRLRGHKDLNSIAFYVGLDNVNEPVEASRHLFRRGHFGYLYSLLVDLINPHTEFTMEEKTAAIESLREYFTPIQVENNSRFFLIQQQRQNTITQMILNMDSSSIMEKLNAVYNETQPAKIAEAQCLSETCMNANSDCLNCPLLLPKVFMLQKLKEELERLLTELQNCSPSNNIKAQKLTYLILNRLNLVNEASKTFGKDYINTFIDLKELKINIGNVQHLLNVRGEM